MADIEITQAEANTLIEMEKEFVESDSLSFPEPGDHMTIPLTSRDKRENFTLDVRRYQIKLTKANYQNRARQAIVLIRLDLDGALHRNPDGEEIPCPHLHVYKEGYGDKWAIPAPVSRYPDVQDLVATLEAFMRHCNIVDPPQIQRRLF